MSNLILLLPVEQREVHYDYSDADDFGQVVVPASPIIGISDLIIYRTLTSEKRPHAQAPSDVYGGAFQYWRKVSCLSPGFVSNQTRTAGEFRLLPFAPCKRVCYNDSRRAVAWLGCTTFWGEENTGDRMGKWVQEVTK